MILTKKKMYPKTDMLNISNIKKGGFHINFKPGNHTPLGMWRKGLFFTKK